MEFYKPQKSKKRGYFKSDAARAIKFDEIKIKEQNINIGSGVDFRSKNMLVKLKNLNYKGKIILDKSKLDGISSFGYIKLKNMI